MLSSKLESKSKEVDRLRQEEKKESVGVKINYTYDGFRAQSV